MQLVLPTETSKHHHNKKINKILNSQIMRMTKNLLKMMTKSNLKRQSSSRCAAAGVGAAGAVHHNKHNKHHNEEKILVKTISTITTQMIRKRWFHENLVTTHSSHSYSRCNSNIRWYGSK